MRNTTTNGLTKGQILALAEEAMRVEGIQAWFPGVDPDSVSHQTLADYLEVHASRWTVEGLTETGSYDHWTFDGDPHEVAAYAVEKGARKVHSQTFEEARDLAVDAWYTGRAFELADQYGLYSDRILTDGQSTVTWLINGDGSTPYVSVPYGTDTSDPDGYVNIGEDGLTLS